MSSIPHLDYGRRLIPNIIDNYAHQEPDKTFALVTRTLAMGDSPQEITFYQFASAINRCALWLEAQCGKGEEFPTIAYLAPSDLRTSILIVAAIKAGFKVELLDAFDLAKSGLTAYRVFSYLHEIVFKHI